MSPNVPIVVVNFVKSNAKKKKKDTHLAAVYTVDNNKMHKSKQTNPHAHLGGVAPTATGGAAVFDGGKGGGGIAWVRFAIRPSFLRSAANRPRMLDTTIS